MNPELEKRIDAKDTWSFRECVGLASEFNLKPRYVIAFILSKGKNYIDHEEKTGEEKSPRNS